MHLVQRQHGNNNGYERTVYSSLSISPAVWQLKCTAYNELLCRIALFSWPCFRPGFLALKIQSGLFGYLALFARGRSNYVNDISLCPPLFLALHVAKCSAEIIHSSYAVSC
jgi:hypothetical protein